MKKISLVFSFLTVFMSFQAQADVNTRLETMIPLLSWLTLKLGINFKVSNETAGAIAAGALVTKIGYDLSWHNDYATKSNDSFGRFMNYVRFNNITSLKDPSLYAFFNSIDPDFCLMYESWLRNSYDSWLTPWNWTASQKAAYEKMEILSMIALHGPMIALSKEEVEKKLVDHARKHCSVVCEYPLVYYGNQIDAHLAALKKGFSICNQAVQGMLAQLHQELYELKYVLRGNQTYIAECQTLKTHQLLQQAAQSR
jgi:primosomal replication protein N